MSRRSLEAQLTDLGSLSASELGAAWQRVYGSEPPRLGPDLLRHGIAYRLQEKALGGLPAPLRRQLEQAAAGEQVRASKPPRALRSGAQLVREWQGRTICVEVVDGGFLWEGVVHASLSSIAKAVTGAHWSGPRFFGLTSTARG